MSKILLLGASGMLGHAIYRKLCNDHELTITVRHEAHLGALSIDRSRHEILFYDALWPTDSLLQKDYDFVINAIGVTIPFADNNPRNTYYVNGIFPHLLARLFGKTLIHITTDCVFDGDTDVPYDEDSTHSPIGHYAISKSIGEPTECLTLRTSIIGRELHGFTGLLEWFLKQRGKTIQGYTEHFWNGLTTNEYANICKKIIENPEHFQRKGIHHIHSTTVSKYQMLQAFERKYKTGCVIVPNGSSRKNRTLSSGKLLNKLLEIPSFEQMLEEM